jgi:hypothetical protein
MSEEFKIDKDVPVSDARLSKYPIHELNYKESFFIPAEVFKDSKRPSQAVHAIIASFNRQHKGNKKLFARKRKETIDDVEVVGWRIWRIK